MQGQSPDKAALGNVTSVTEQIMKVTKGDDPPISEVSKQQAPPLAEPRKEKKPKKPTSVFGQATADVEQQRDDSLLAGKGNNTSAIDDTVHVTEKGAMQKDKE